MYNSLNILHGYMKVKICLVCFYVCVYICQSISMTGSTTTFDFVLPDFGGPADRVKLKNCLQSSRHRPPLCLYRV